MKFLLLDVYPKKPYRINKDQNGGYGTANNYGFGNSFISRILRKIVFTLFLKTIDTIIFTNRSEYEYALKNYSNYSKNIKHFL